VPGAKDTTRTVTLKYRARNALRFFEDHDELYWNVNRRRVGCALGDVSARITLPSGAAGVRATPSTAPMLHQPGGRVAIDGGAIRVDAARKLEFKEGLTAVVGWDKGLVAEPTTAQRTAGFLAANWPLPCRFRC
jgi:hypothetical protein